jgi:ribosomal protein L20
MPLVAPVDLNALNLALKANEEVGIHVALKILADNAVAQKQAFDLLLARLKTAKIIT